MTFCHTLDYANDVDGYQLTPVRHAVGQLCGPPAFLTIPKQLLWVV